MCNNPFVLFIKKPSVTQSVWTDLHSISWYQTLITKRTINITLIYIFTVLRGPQSLTLHILIFKSFFFLNTNIDALWLNKNVAQTFFLSSEWNYILSVLVLQGFLLQVFEKAVSVELSCWFLTSLVLLAQACWEKSILGRQRIEGTLDLTWMHWNESFQLQFKQ